MFKKLSCVELMENMRGWPFGYFFGKVHKKYQFRIILHHASCTFAGARFKKKECRATFVTPGIFEKF